MAAFDLATLDRWRALAIVDRDGTTVGTIKEFYLDRETGYPTWALVNTGLFGTTQTFVPLVHATEISDGLQVPYEKNHIKDAPKVDLRDELSPNEEAELFAHYGVEYQPSSDAGSDADLAAGTTPNPGTPESADPDPGSAPPAEGPGPVRVDAGPESTPTGVDGQALGAVPPEPGSVDIAESGHDTAGFEAATDVVPAEPGTTSSEATDDAAPAEPGTIPSEATNAAQAEPGTIRSEATNDGAPAEPATTTFEAANNAVPAEPGTTEGVGTTPPDLDPERSRPEPHDPDLARTAPVEPGLPGSTASSPYGTTSTTVDKDVADPSGSSTEQPLRLTGDAGWAPGDAGSFKEHEPFDRPTAASDRWREAKLAAERDRVARAAAAQPEERSPLERARRRLERLVGGGQDHPDEASPADREAAERARRARLGLDEDDDQRNP
jgi:PRC-barrel domain